MPHFQTSLMVRSRGEGLFDFTDQARAWVRECADQAGGIKAGLLTVFCRHTSASLIIQENADPNVRLDLVDFFNAMVPQSHSRYRHSEEGPDDMPAHIRSALTSASLSVPVADGRLLLGTWQAIYLFEHRSRGHAREVLLHLHGD